MVACTTKHRLTLSVTGNCGRNPELEFHLGVSLRSFNSEFQFGVSSIRQTLDSTGDFQELGKDHVRGNRTQWNSAGASRPLLKPQRLVDDEGTGRGSLNQ